jgi:hypothetical protein
MELLEERRHVHAGNEFVLKLFRETDRLLVRAFLDSKLVSPEYSIQIVTAQNYFWEYQRKLSDNLFDLSPRRTSMSGCTSDLDSQSIVGPSGG